MSSGQSGRFTRAGLEILLRQLPDAVQFVDQAGRVVMTNREQEPPPGQAAESLSELPRGLKVFHPDGRPYEGMEWPLARTLGSGEVIADEEWRAADVRLDCGRGSRQARSELRADGDERRAARGSPAGGCGARSVARWAS